MQVECFKVKLKADTIENVREWSAYLNSKIDQVKNLLKEEGMALESVFLEQGKEGNFLIYYLRAKDLQKTRENSRASQHPIDLYHREVMQKIVEETTKLECLLDASGD